MSTETDTVDPIDVQYDLTNPDEVAQLRAALGAEVREEFAAMLDEATAFIHEGVAEVMCRIFAELPPDAIPIVRAAMEKAAATSTATEACPIDFSPMLLDMARPN